MLHYCCDGLTDHFKNPFFSFTSYASAVLGPPDGLEALGASAGASVGLDADADPLGASELDVEELAPSAKGATATAARGSRQAREHGPWQRVLVFRLARL